MNTRRCFNLTVALIAATLMLALVRACDFLPYDAGKDGKGVITLSLNGSVFSKASIPDSSKFLLRLVNSSDDVVYEGAYGDAPASFVVPAGVYSVSIRSGEFKTPSFEDQVYGDDQIVHISAGSNINVLLVCTLMNCGVKLQIDSSFPQRISDASLSLRGAEGSLPYGMNESRIAYFRPGDISLVLTKASEDKILTTRSLAAREVLRLKVLASPVTGAGIGVQVDTSVVWIDDTFALGGESGAMDVASARNMEGAEGVWVYGYIVGCASPFLGDNPSSTNLAIAGKTSAKEKSECMSVELKKGPVRDALNLVQNPSNKGRKLFIKGDIIKYYGIPGVKNITEWSLDNPPGSNQ